MTNSIDTFIEEFTEIQAEFQKQAQVKLKELFTEFWEKNPGVKAAFWTQYAPYFNDGDPCTFSVHDTLFTNAEGEDLDDINCEDYEGEKEDIWVEYSFDPRWCKVVPEEAGVDVESCDHLRRLLCSSVMKDVMKAMFGEDSKVYATREGFKIEEYGENHD
ncbi:hypothetical protein b3_0140 [Synechococcus phage B3]|nr:hypothetical protein b3_0140 [Synechococcus phage B3]QGT54754.1 hypothetical protein b23_0139 [Synechococcus phage B23]